MGTWQRAISRTRASSISFGVWSFAENKGRSSRPGRNKSPYCRASLAADSRSCGSNSRASLRMNSSGRSPLSSSTPSLRRQSPSTQIDARLIKGTGSGTPGHRPSVNSSNEVVGGSSGMIQPLSVRPWGELCPIVTHGSQPAYVDWSDTFLIGRSTRMFKIHMDGRTLRHAVQSWSLTFRLCLLVLAPGVSLALIAFAARR
jgi:hypothetical protein